MKSRTDYDGSRPRRPAATRLIYPDRHTRQDTPSTALIADLDSPRLLSDHMYVDDRGRKTSQRAPDAVTGWTRL